jgi:glycosyltransferase involved in cell wall biosynthesis
MEKKIKVLTLGDHPLSPSGVGTQTRYMIEALLKTGKFNIISFGGAISHNDYQPTKTEQWGDDWVIFPVDGYGSADQIRSVMRNERPDVLWFMTDPRFYAWLWQIEDEVRPMMPMVYYHVWDNYPYPKFNTKFYDSNDLIVTISKVTDDICKTLCTKAEVKHIPHAVNTEIFKPVTAEQKRDLREKSFSEEADRNKVLFFWNNRNARRKQSGSLIFWFKQFLDRVGHDKACLIMHTDPKDGHGQDLEAIVRELGVDKGQVLFSVQKIAPENLAAMYAMCDCTVNVSDAEGFGLATLESLACEVPIIVNMTGGLQEQITDGENWFGIGIEPCSKAIIGSQEIPWIYEDRVNGDTFVQALENIYNASEEERTAMGKAGREHVIKNYSFEFFEEEWVKTMLDLHKKHGSWDTRSNYKAWRFEEV